MTTWKIVESNPRYEVSDEGDVRNTRTGNIKKCRINTSGYHWVSLYEGKDKQKCELVHRLVAIAFLPNPLGLPEVDHIDKDINNNKLSNLRWVDKKTNCEKSYMPKRGKIVITPIAQLTPEGEVVGVYQNQSTAARENGISRSCITRVVNKNRKTYKGFIWKRISQEEYEKYLSLLNSTGQHSNKN